MAFPLDYGGELTLRTKKALAAAEYQQTLVQGMVAALAAVDGSPVVQDNRISFTGGLFRFVGNWNVLVSITGGYVDITVSGDQVLIAYYIRFTQVLLVTTLYSLIVIALTVCIPQRGGIFAAICLLVVGWVGTLGFNVFGSIVRFGSFIERTLRRA